MNRRPLQLLLSLCLATTVLTSCGGGQDPLTTIKLAGHSSIRQISAIDGNPLRVGVSVNAGQEQVFTVISSDSASLDITGVNINAQNLIEITWYEILNGYDVEISTQQQQFVADGSTNIDASHQHTQFDYDGDGVSNYDERIAGTCVWLLEPDCALDVPATVIEESAVESAFSNNSINNFPEQNGVNVIFNSDMSRGLDGWFMQELEQLTTSNAEICFSTLPSAVFPENASMGTLQGLFLLEE